MSTPTQLIAPPLTIALAGNPNAGKTSIFNALTGAHHKVGNYPGVTVEKREGTIEFEGRTIHIVDLPGIYSLTAYSLDEVVARDFLLNEKPDVVIDVLDSTNLERNLYLLLQLIELNLPVVAALNMTDEAEQKGILINDSLLSKTLGVPMIPTVGSRGEGVQELLTAAIAVYEAHTVPHMPNYGEDIEAHISTLTILFEKDPAFASQYSSRWMAIKLTEKDADALQRISGHAYEVQLRAALEQTWHWILLHYHKDPEILMSEQRYGYIHGAVAEAIHRKRPQGIPLTEQIDNVVMHPFISVPLFFFVIWAIFEITFALGNYPMTWLEALFAWLADIVQRSAFAPPVRDFLVHGIIHGVGGVPSFTPLIVILFFCISFLEDTGYIARAAFLTDQFLHAIGLHGQSFMPLMLGFGCSVPAIMATRTLKSPKERIATILAIPFISCGGKLPVYVLLAGTFFPNHAATVVMLIYAAGVVVSILSTYFLRRTVLKGQSTPFVMELPPYRMPTLKGVLWHVWEKTWSYVKKAGTVILAMSVLMWIITSYPKMNGSEQYQLEHSIAGQIGKIIEPVIAPIGFSWKMGVALLPGLSAKELVVSTLGVLYGSSDEGEEVNASLREALRNAPDWSPRIALAMLIFILVMPPCFSSLATIRAEAGNKWLVFQVVYSLVLAWILAFLTSWIGGLFGLT